jgi:hypothetical protein
MLLKKDLTEYNRYQAFAIHLAISLIVFLILLVCITQYWYPGLLFEIGNAWKAIGIIAGIDLILGPALTLIIFNPQKKSLKFDLAVIAIIQTAALIYGTWTIQKSHPIALAHIGSNFHIIHANAPFADDINALAKKSNYQLYYLINNEDLSTKLKPQQFYPYSQYKQSVIQEQISMASENPYLIRIKRPGKPYGLRIDPISAEIQSLEPIKVSK